MVFSGILYPFIAISTLGILFGIGLAIAGRLLAVKKDEKLLSIEGILPGINCGACGFAGCASYAEAIAQENAELTKCAPGGAETAKALASIMGMEIVVSDEKKVTQVHCRGSAAKVQYKYDYRGIGDCNALFMMGEGNKQCRYGCLALGSCIKVCPVDAISYDTEGCVWVDRNMCISCGKCIDACPTGVMKFIPYDADFLVACNSKDKGAITKKYCEVGCIGCKLCEKKSPDGGYIIDGFLAHIDYQVKGERQEGCDACPQKCILNLSRLDEKD